MCGSRNGEHMGSVLSLPFRLIMVRQFGDGDGDVNPPSLTLWRDYGHEMRPVGVPLHGYGSALFETLRG